MEKYLIPPFETIDNEYGKITRIVKNGELVYSIKGKREKNREIIDKLELKYGFVIKSLKK